MCISLVSIIPCIWYYPLPAPLSDKGSYPLLCMSMCMYAPHCPSFVHCSMALPWCSACFLSTESLQQAQHSMGLVALKTDPVIADAAAASLSDRDRVTQSRICAPGMPLGEPADHNVPPEFFCLALHLLDYLAPPYCTAQGSSMC